MLCTTSVKTGKELTVSFAQDHDKLHYQAGVMMVRISLPATELRKESCLFLNAGTNPIIIIIIDHFAKFLTFVQ